jgi:hypothetical protein
MSRIHKFCATSSDQIVSDVTPLNAFREWLPVEKRKKCLGHLLNPKVLLLPQRNITTTDGQPRDSRPRNNRRPLKGAKVPPALHISPLQTTCHAASTRLEIAFIIIRKNGNTTAADAVHIAEAAKYLSLGSPLNWLGSFSLESHGRAGSILQQKAAMMVRR